MNEVVSIALRIMQMRVWEPEVPPLLSETCFINDGEDGCLIEDHDEDNTERSYVPFQSPVTN